MERKRIDIYLWIFLLLLLINTNSISQDLGTTKIYDKEQKIKEYFNQIHYSLSDDLKKGYNDSIITLFRKILDNQESFEYPFDSLKRMGKITSPDRCFRIYNWNLSYLDGSYEYFGFIQKYDKEENLYKQYALTDKSFEIENPENALLDHTNWYGALYYKIISVKKKKKEYYVLLALDLNNLLTTRKIVESLYFDEKGLPKFGIDVFEINKKKQKRVLFEYSSNATMSLSYHENKKIIVFDHLSPSKPGLEGKYQYYGPDFSYDALVLQKGEWRYVNDVDARNNP